MRDIIFRGKREDNGEWITESETYIKDGDGTWLCDESNDVVKVLPETVGQYMGLTDRNDKKIFEGDIVKLTDDYNDFEWKAVVVFGNPGGAYCWGWNFLPIDGYKGTTDILMWVEMETTGAYCEVIGNIHDNPELLEGGVDNG